MTGSVTIDDINLIIGLILGVQNLHQDSRLIEDLGAESVDILNILASIEEKYLIRINDSEVGRGLTPYDLFTIVTLKLAEKNH